MQLFLSGFNYSAKFNNSTDNTNVDCLFRLPINPQPCTDSSINEEVHLLCEGFILWVSTQKLTFQSLQEKTLKDELLSKIIYDLRESNTTESEFTIHNNILFRGQRVVIPFTLQALVLQELHRTHIGISKMKQLARRYVYWKSIDKDIERLVRECVACANIKTSPAKAPLHP